MRRLFAHMVFPHAPAVEFTATLITRDAGTGAKRIMDENPERGRYIKRFTGWSQVEAGTLTLDHAQPLPLCALKNVDPLSIEPDGLLTNLQPNDASIAKKRGAPAYYGGIIRAYEVEKRVVLSQQPRPAVPHRLEVIADVHLRDALQVKDGDRLILGIYQADDWRGLLV